MECEFNRIPYKRRLDNYLGHEHLKASMQPRKYLEDTFEMKFGELEDAFRSTRMPTVLDYEKLRGLSDPSTRDCGCGVLFLGYGMGYGPCPTSVVTTHSVVELLIQ
jgi:hypothetical protein